MKSITGCLCFVRRQRPRIGGAPIAVGGDRSAIEVRVEQDRLLLHGVASAQIVEVVDNRVSLL
jgi:hypothetical protein